MPDETKKYINLPALHKFMLGDIEVMVLSDGTATVPTEKLMLNAKPGEVASLMQDAYVALDYEASINTFLFKCAGKLILIDTGAGELMGPSAGHLFSSLEAAGFSPDDIDIVMLTHIHSDHSGGLIADGKPAFKNAVLYVSRHDFEFWLSEEQMRSAKPERQQSFRNAVAKVKPWADTGMIRTFNFDQEFLPGLRSWAQPGHTPGHTYFVLESRGSKLVFCGDIVHVAEIQLPNPEIAITLDVDPVAAVSKRKEFLSIASAEGFWLAADHISFPGIGHVRQSGNGYRWIPVPFSVRSEN
jgi:glyoxylase-like metal-dependent hydrolase (beta-lactamase superfamily II)